MSERPTVRPVTLARLVELTNVCEDKGLTTESIETELDVSHRRARETLLEAVRINLLIEETTENKRESESKTCKDGEDAEDTADDMLYRTTDVGERFLDAVRTERWERVSQILQAESPHYGAFLETVQEIDPAEPKTVLRRLENKYDDAQYDFNQTSIDVIGDWGERLGAIQRNAFTGTYYRPIGEITSDFDQVLLSVFDDLEETAGVNLTQRYLSIPEIREHACERLRCPRQAFDDALQSLAAQNVGKVELSGAPMDTGAKDAMLGIKQIELAHEDGLVSTAQSTDQVMTGVEQYGKQYYYLAIHDEDLTYTPETEP